MLVLRVIFIGTLIFLSGLEASYYTSRPEHNALSTSREVYSKYRPGRRVCTESQSSSQAHVEPYYEEFSHVCGSGQICKGFRLNFRTVFSSTASASAGSRPPVYSCCPGWMQTSKTHHGCHRRKAGTPNPAPVPEITTSRASTICHPSCLHGGRCIGRDLCHCPAGFTGSRCEQDIDECKEKNCDQMCVNTPGSFHCQCRNNFDLLEDGHSCRHNGRGIIASEAKDLEYELLEDRIINLEKAIYSEKRHPKKDYEFILNNDIDKKLERITSDNNAVKKELMKIKNESIGYKNIMEKVKYLEYEIEKIIPYLSIITNLKLKLEKCNCHYGQGNRIKR